MLTYKRPSTIAIRSKPPLGEDWASPPAITGDTTPDVAGQSPAPHSLVSMASIPYQRRRFSNCT